MIMRENEKKPSQGRALSPVTERVLAAGMILIGLPLFGVIVAVSDTPVLTAAAAARYGGMMEYLAAGLAVLTAGSYLVERVSREVHNK